jgi:hypothetical protein
MRMVKEVVRVSADDFRQPSDNLDEEHQTVAWNRASACLKLPEWEATLFPFPRQGSALLGSRFFLPAHECGGLQKRRV